MRVIFFNSFRKDIEKLKSAKLKNRLKLIIIQLEEAKNLTEVGQIIKMSGHPSAYRIRVGAYRLGFYYENNTVQLARFVKRNDIYKLFP